MQNQLPTTLYAGPCASTQAERHTYWHLQHGQDAMCPWDCSATPTHAETIVEQVTQ